MFFSQYRKTFAKLYVFVFLLSFLFQSFSGLSIVRAEDTPHAEMDSESVRMASLVFEGVMNANEDSWVERWNVIPQWKQQNWLAQLIQEIKRHPLSIRTAELDFIQALQLHQEPIDPLLTQEEKEAIQQQIIPNVLWPIHAELVMQLYDPRYAKDSMISQLIFETWMDLNIGKKWESAGIRADQMRYLIQKLMYESRIAMIEQRKNNEPFSYYLNIAFQTVFQTQNPLEKQILSLLTEEERIAFQNNGMMPSSFQSLSRTIQSIVLDDSNRDYVLFMKIKSMYQIGGFHWNKANQKGFQDHGLLQLMQYTVDELQAQSITIDQFDQAFLSAVKSALIQSGLNDLYEEHQTIATAAMMNLGYTPPFLTPAKEVMKQHLFSRDYLDVTLELKDEFGPLSNILISELNWNQNPIFHQKTDVNGRMTLTLQKGVHEFYALRHFGDNDGYRFQIEVQDRMNPIVTLVTSHEDWQMKMPISESVARASASDPNVKDELFIVIQNENTGQSAPFYFDRLVLDPYQNAVIEAWIPLKNQLNITASFYKGSQLLKTVKKENTSSDFYQAYTDPYIEKFNQIKNEYFYLGNGLQWSDLETKYNIRDQELYQLMKRMIDRLNQFRQSNEGQTDPSWEKEWIRMYQESILEFPDLKIKIDQAMIESHHVMLEQNLLPRVFKKLMKLFLLDQNIMGSLVVQIKNEQGDIISPEKGYFLLYELDSMNAEQQYKTRMESNQRFVFERIMPGTYEVVFVPLDSLPYRMSSQVVSISHDATTHVELVVKERSYDPNEIYFWNTKSNWIVMKVSDSRSDRIPLLWGKIKQISTGKYVATMEFESMWTDDEKNTNHAWSYLSQTLLSPNDLAVDLYVGNQLIHENFQLKAEMNEFHLDQVSMERHLVQAIKSAYSQSWSHYQWSDLSALGLSDDDMKTLIQAVLAQYVQIDPHAQKPEVRMVKAYHLAKKQLDSNLVERIERALTPAQKSLLDLYALPDVARESHRALLRYTQNEVIYPIDVRVIDENGNGIPKADIMLYGLGSFERFIDTNENGMVYSSTVYPGEKILTVYAKGYKGVKKELLIDSTRRTEIEIVMKKTNDPDEERVFIGDYVRVDLYGLKPSKRPSVYIVARDAETNQMINAKTIDPSTCLRTNDDDCTVWMNGFMGKPYELHVYEDGKLVYASNPEDPNHEVRFQNSDAFIERVMSVYQNGNYAWSQLYKRDVTEEQMKTFLDLLYTTYFNMENDPSSIQQTEEERLAAAYQKSVALASDELRNAITGALTASQRFALSLGLVPSFAEPLMQVLVEMRNPANDVKAVVRITDEQGNPIQNAGAWIGKINRGFVMSTVDQTFEQNVPKGDYVIVINAEGYAGQMHHVKLDQNKTFSYVMSKAKEGDAPYLYQDQNTYAWMKGLDVHTHEQLLLLVRDPDTGRIISNHTIDQSDACEPETSTCGLWWKSFTGQHVILEAYMGDEPFQLVNVVDAKAGEHLEMAVSIPSTPTPTPMPTHTPEATPSTTPVPTVSPSPLPTETPSATAPVFIGMVTTNASSYAPGDLVRVQFKLNHVEPGTWINSAEFKVAFDSNAFALATQGVDEKGNLLAVVNGDGVQAGPMTPTAVTLKGNVIHYLVASTKDYAITNDQVLFTITFIAKAFSEQNDVGSKTFHVLPSTMLNEQLTIYEMASSTTDVQLVEPGETIDAYLSLYLGEDTGLKDVVLNQLSQETIDASFADLHVQTKSADGTLLQTFSGESIWVKGSNGEIATRNIANQMTGHLRIENASKETRTIEISGGGYVRKVIPVTFTNDEIHDLNTSMNAPLMMLCGDLGSIDSTTKKLVTASDHVISNLDFSVWLMLYKETTLSVDLLRRADLSKDGKITNLDFSLWLSAYRKG